MCRCRRWRCLDNISIAIIIASSGKLKRLDDHANGKVNFVIVYLQPFRVPLPDISDAFTMPQKLLKSAQYIELGSYQYWPVLIPRGIRLYTYEQIPVFLKDNPYITDGYRAHLPSRLCIKR